MGENISDYLWQIETIPTEFYLYQEEQLDRNDYFQGPRGRKEYFEQDQDDMIHPVIREFVEYLGYRDVGEVKCHKYSYLKELTNDFGRENFIQETYTGRLFRVVAGNYFDDLEATVKIWDFAIPITPRYHCNQIKFVGELAFLSKGISDSSKVKHLSHPNLVKLGGYSFDKVLAVVYDLQPGRCLVDEITSNLFDWKSRMEVAIEIADLLCYIHDEEYAVKSVASTNIMIDKKGNAQLLSTGLVVDKNNFDHPMPYEGYTGPPGPMVRSPLNDQERDILMYGLMLLELISKQVIDHRNPNPLIKKLKDTLGKGNRFVVEDLIVADTSAKFVSDLALQCVDPTPGTMSMTTIREQLEKVVAEYVV